MRRSFVVVAAILAALSLLATQALAADINGTPGSDTIVGTAGNDNINGLAGHDHIQGLGGGDIIIGSFGNDTLVGGDGVDHLYGRSGKDKLWGEAEDCLGSLGENPLCASPDKDAFYAGTNNDVVSAADGVGYEIVNCGGGFDSAIVDATDITTGCEFIGIPV